MKQESCMSRFLKNDPNDERRLLKENHKENYQQRFNKIRDQIGAGSFKGALHASKIVLSNIKNWKIKIDLVSSVFKC